MSDEDKNFSEEDFKDFDEVSDNIEFDSDLSGIDEEAVERALQNVVSQMSGDEQEPLESVSPENKEAAMPSDEVQEADTEKSIFLSNKNTESQEESTEDKLNDFQEENQEEKSQETEHDNKENHEVITANEEELSQWEEYNSANDVVKKYIVYVSKDFVPYIDNLTTDERSAYINDAIQQKLDSQDEEKQKIVRRNALIHFILAVVVILAVTPLGLILANKAIMATFDNYKYSQENFEKLYKHRFEHDRAYMRSLQYNQEYEKKLKNSTEK